MSFPPLFLAGPFERAAPAVRGHPATIEPPSWAYGKRCGEYHPLIESALPPIFRAAGLQKNVSADCKPMHRNLRCLVALPMSRHLDRLKPVLLDPVLRECQDRYGASFDFPQLLSVIDDSPDTAGRFATTLHKRLSSLAEEHGCLFHRFLELMGLNPEGNGHRFLHLLAVYEALLYLCWRQASISSDSPAAKVWRDIIRGAQGNSATWPQDSFFAGLCELAEGERRRGRPKPADVAQRSGPTRPNFSQEAIFLREFHDWLEQVDPEIHAGFLLAVFSKYLHSSLPGSTGEPDVACEQDGEMARAIEAMPEEWRGLLRAAWLRLAGRQDRRNDGRGRGHNGYWGGDFLGRLQERLENFPAEYRVWEAGELDMLRNRLDENLAQLCCNRLVRTPDPRLDTYAKPVRHLFDTLKSFRQQYPRHALTRLHGTVQSHVADMLVRDLPSVSIQRTPS